MPGATVNTPEPGLRLLDGGLFNGARDGVILLNPTLPVGSLFYESYSGNITATTGGQSGALQLVSELNVVSTVTAGYGVKLPIALGGLTIIVANTSANSLIVYGNGTDTIDGVAAATGVTQMPGSNTVFSCASNGAWTTNGIGTGYAGSFPTQSFTSGIVAHAGGGQASAVLLITVYNQVSTVATTGDSLRLPVSSPGMQLTIMNRGANTLALFPASGETINGGAANASVNVATNQQAVMTCTLAGSWFGPIALA